MNHRSSACLSASCLIRSWATKLGRQVHRVSWRLLSLSDIMMWSHCLATTYQLAKTTFLIIIMHAQYLTIPSCHLNFTTITPHWKLELHLWMIDDVRLPVAKTIYHIILLEIHQLIKRQKTNVITDSLKNNINWFWFVTLVSCHRFLSITWKNQLIKEFKNERLLLNTVRESGSRRLRRYVSAHLEHEHLPSEEGHSVEVAIADVGFAVSRQCGPVTGRVRRTGMPVVFALGGRMRPSRG